MIDEYSQLQSRMTTQHLGRSCYIFQKECTRMVVQNNIPLLLGDKWVCGKKPLWDEMLSQKITNMKHVFLCLPSLWHQCIIICFNLEKILCDDGLMNVMDRFFLSQQEQTGGKQDNEEMYKRPIHMGLSCPPPDCKLTLDPEESSSTEDLGFNERIS